MVARKMNKYLNGEILKITLTDVIKAQSVNLKGLVGQNREGKLSSYTYSTSSIGDIARAQMTPKQSNKSGYTHKTFAGSGAQMISKDKTNLGKLVSKIYASGESGSSKNKRISFNTENNNQRGTDHSNINIA